MGFWTRKPTQKEYKRPFKPWISDLIRDKIEKKNCKGNPEIREQLNLEYKNIKEETTERLLYISQYFSENAENLHKIWKGN